MRCECLYCYDDLCFKPGKGDDELVAVPCDGCEDEPTTTRHAQIIT